MPSSNMLLKPGAEGRQSHLRKMFVLVGQLGYPKKECFGKGSLTVITEFQKLDCIFE